MSDNYLDYLQMLYAIFEKDFSEAYKRSNKKYRKRLLPHIGAIFRRWYYATFMEDVPLTPANIMESLNLAFKQPPLSSPVIKLRSDQRYNGFKAEMHHYSAAQHPVVADLKQVVTFCYPDIALNEQDYLDEQPLAALTSQLSLPDSNYAIYLLDTATQLKLITKIPSIYANRAQVSRHYEEKFDLSEEALFGEIVESTIKQAALAMNSLFPVPDPLFNESFIRAILKKPMDTDEIFQKVYDLMGFTLEDLFEQDFDDDIDELDAAFLSGTFMLGVFIDRYFFTPMGHYLKLIRPVYMLPFDFDSEFKYFLDSPDEDDTLLTFYAPCSKYYLTDLGLAYLKVKPNHQNYIDIAEKMPFDRIKVPVECKLNAKDLSPIRRDMKDYTLEGDAYIFKIKSNQNTALWLNLALPAEATLHRLYLEAATYFRLERNAKYSFFHGESENPFAEYIAPPKTRSAKKTAEVTLEELDFEHQQQMILATYHQLDPFAQKAGNITLRFSLRLMQVKPREPGQAYPSVVRMSKALKEFHDF